MAAIRFGIIGVGGMGNAHLRYLVNIKGVKVTAVCDIVEQRAAKAAAESGAVPFLDYRNCLDSGLVDAVIIATTHYFHAPIAIHAIKNGIHVISEKPLGVSLTPVDELLRVAKRCKNVKFAVMFQQRTLAVYQKARQMIRSGELGRILRVHYIHPSYRCQAYYDQDAWRGTWDQEGGGVLVNQAPHATDMLWYLLGDPKTVLGKVCTRLHSLEAEEEAEALLEFPDGATGHYFTSTNEFPGRNYTRILGDKGVLEFEGHILRFGKLKTPLSVFDKVNKEPWASPEVVWKEIPCHDAKLVGHEAVTRNFIDAIRRGAPLISPGIEGIHQVEISCAIVLSSYTGKPVTLPVDRAAYDRLLARLIREHAGVKGKKARTGAKHTKVVKVFS
jgi:predicted dehydrogenase